MLLASFRLPLALLLVLFALLPCSSRLQLSSTLLLLARLR
jgi:hypothetical protein